MDYKQLQKLPTPFYRVSIKAIILDDQNRLLVGRGEEDDEGWELPGGGFEHNENLDECLKREIQEELGAEIKEIGKTLFVYRGRSKRGWMILRVAVQVVLANHEFGFGDMKQARFVTKKQLLGLSFAAEEGTIKNYVDLIWPNSR